ncbi:hypothetical protein D3C80_267480 [compost metagenome]
MLRRTFSRFQCDVTREAFCHDHINSPFADTVAFNKAGILQPLQRCIAQNLGSFLDLVEAFNFFCADVKQANRWLFYLEKRARHTRAHHRIIHELARIGTDSRTDIQHNTFTAQSRPDSRNSRALYIGQHAQTEL